MRRTLRAAWAACSAAAWAAVEEDVARLLGAMACPDHGEASRRLPEPPQQRVGERGVPLLGWRVLDLRHTMELVRAGASLVRLQVPELAWMRAAAPQDAAVLRGALLALAADAATARGVAPAACLGVDDVLSPGWASKLATSGGPLHAGLEAESPRASLEKLAPALVPQLVALRPHAGLLCSGMVVRAEAWGAAHASKFELQELWALALQERRLLLLLGEAAPPPEMLSPALRHAALVAARHVESAALLQDFQAALVGLRDQAEAFDVVLVIGVATGLGALLAAGLDCVVQAVDAGNFDVLPTIRAAGPPPGLSTLCGSSGSEPCAGGAEPWGGPDFHPRPHLRRAGARWQSLNGPWDAHIGLASDQRPPGPGAAFDDGTLEVPFPAESARGGLARRRIAEFEALWLRRVLEVPQDWPRVLLRVDACDWECSVYVDGDLVGVHRGAYDPLAVDLTPALSQASGPHKARAELLLRVWDPTDAGCEYVTTPPVPCVRCCTSGWQPRGKQSLQPGFIMYSAATGPWQTIWLEEARHPCLVRSAAALLLNGEAAAAGGAAKVRVEVQLEPAAGPCAVGTRLLAVLALGGQELARAEGEGPLAVELEAPGPPRLWSTEDPVLYTAALALCEMGSGSCGDFVELQFGLRWLSVSTGSDVGPSQEQELLLNGRRIFQHGVLHQAYWPESLIAPPSYAALADEVRNIKESGFNLVRVHAAVMPAAFYHLCDQVGLLVWQDFPAGDGRALPLWDHARAEVEQRLGVAAPLDEVVRTEESAADFWLELQAVVGWLSAFTCIVCWVPFNEAWGQFETVKVVRWLRDFGGGRWVNAASGWNDIADMYPQEDLGDVADVHNYEGPPFQRLNGTFTAWPLPFAGRALALGEYGGLGLTVDGHESAPDESWAYGQVSRTPAELRDALFALGGRLAALLCESRLSAAVYTQWNDIETEVNGLVTYDRVPKVDRASLRELAALLHGAHARCRPSAGEPAGAR